MTEYVTLDDLMAAARRLLGDDVAVRDVGLLLAAVARPQQSAFGADAYPDRDSKAAALLHSVVKNHALVDGNKRLGWLAVNLFYGYNGYELVVDEDSAYDLVMGVASGQHDDVGEIATILAGWVESLRLP